MLAVCSTTADDLVRCLLFTDNVNVVLKWVESDVYRCVDLRPGGRTPAFRFFTYHPPNGPSSTPRPSPLEYG